jgi:hypothetical protein
MVCRDHYSREENRSVTFRKLAIISLCAPRKPYPDALFLKRRTSRIGLLPTPIGEAALATLATLAMQWGQRYEQITNSEKIENILAQNTNALFEDLNIPSYHDEIVGRAYGRQTHPAVKLPTPLS